MTDQTTETIARLWTKDGFKGDSWRHAAADGDLAGNSGVILPLADYLALDATLREAEKERLGVLLKPADPIEAIEPYLKSLALVALAFPAFNDGRSFSKAAQLRTLHGYRGVVRASGDVLIDQIPLMLRTGFDEFEVTNPTALKRLEEGRLGGLPLHYQPASDGTETSERYSWRRVPSGA